VYAYATKANFAEEVVRTAISAGAHYETSSAFDVRIAHQLWRNGVLPPERFIFCNGSKEPNYIQAILELRQAGFANVVPILDDPDEFEALAGCREPLLLGVRERKDAGDLALGVIDQRSDDLEETKVIAARVEPALAHFPPDRLMLTSECGFGHVPIEITRAKLRALTTAAEALRAGL
jgi:hypothetical protein